MYSPPRHFSATHEQRLCRFAGEEHVEAGREVITQRSEFLARMVELAEGLQHDPKDVPDKKVLSSDEKWSTVWFVPDVFVVRKITYPTRVDSPYALLLRLDPSERRGLLLDYLRDKFPQKAKKGDRDFDRIDAASLNDLGKKRDVLQSLRSFKVIAQEMSNEDAIRFVVSTTLDDSTAKGAALNELQSCYSGVAGSVRAFEDFSVTMRQHPEIGLTIARNPILLRDALRGDRSQFASALRLQKPNAMIFTEDRLTVMRDKFDAMRKDEERVIKFNESKLAKAKSKIESFETRGIAEKIWDGYSKLETWQQWLLAGAAAWFIGYKYLIKRSKTRLEKWGLGAAGLLVALYPLGGRKLFDGTVVGDMFGSVESWVGQGYDRTIGKLEAKKSPKLTRQGLETYARYFSEIAQKEVGTELEAMMYMSFLSLGLIAQSYTLNLDARGGILDLKDSPLRKKILEELENTGEAQKLLGNITANGDKIGSNLSHIFYTLGAFEKPTEHRKVEEDRGGGTYDALPDGSPARASYRQLAQDGVELAKTKYKDLNYLEVVEKLLNEKKQS